VEDDPVTARLKLWRTLRSLLSGPREGAALAETDELCGFDLAWITERSQKLISHHLKPLRERGVVSRRREGKVVFYELTPAGRPLVERLLSAVDEQA
jgi:DNA-binding transcriptional ArsR family regulator